MVRKEEERWGGLERLLIIKKQDHFKRNVARVNIFINAKRDVGI